MDVLVPDDDGRKGREVGTAELKSKEGRAGGRNRREGQEGGIGVKEGLKGQVGLLLKVRRSQPKATSLGARKRPEICNTRYSTPFKDMFLS